jgi:hypothetical protein
MAADPHGCAENPRFAETVQLELDVDEDDGVSWHNWFVSLTPAAPVEGESS